MQASGVPNNPNEILFANDSYFHIRFEICLMIGTYRATSVSRCPVEKLNEVG